MRKLKVTRIVTSSSEIDFTDQYYPNMTIQQAIQDERDGDNGWEEYFFGEDELDSVQTFVEIIEEEDSL